MSYSIVDLNDATAKFEKCAERQAANKHSAVKLRAAERDLLAAAEKIRDLCIVAVTGKKDKLAEVFGGTCEDLCRIMAVLDAVELSEMHAGDQRWLMCRNQIEGVKQILMDLGSFKPWTMRKNVPEEVVYPALRARFSPGERVNLVPDVTGAFPTNFKVEPVLPDSLRLNKESGVISGQLKPGIELDERTHVVTASNQNGDATCELTFRVKLPPPDTITYQMRPEMIYANEEVMWEPTVTGGIAETWSVTPELPEGLTIDSASGVISGAPKEVAEARGYSVSAENSGGSATLVLRLGVKVAPPVSLSYPLAHDEYTCGTVVYLLPDIVLATLGPRTPSSPSRRRSSLIMPGMKFSVEPALPEGLEIAELVGVITGKAEKPSAKTTYRITAKNDGGETSTELSMTVKLKPPEELTYPDAEDDFYVGEAMMLSPEVEGTVETWKIEGSLPEGLLFDEEMGIIEGTPAEEASCKVKVIAGNETGETRVELSFVVKRAPPSKLAYPVVQSEYPLHRTMTINPTVEGLVDEFTLDKALPEGVAMDPRTGIITGTPVKTTEATMYKVTAVNESGASSTELSFSVLLMPPVALSYPRIDELYNVGEEVQLEPYVEGGATTWAVEPAFPEGVALDLETGKMSGTFSATAERASYVVSASNEAGGTSTVVTFMVTAPAPEGLSYAMQEGEVTAGRDVLIEPELISAVCGTFTITPELPEGMELDSKTGVITGSPTSEAEMAAYTVTVTNIAGSTSAELSFSVSVIPDLEEATQTFASLIERVTDLVELRKMDPSKKRASGDWMLWMVHRAWLNDPELTVFDFDHLHMPLPHQEPRIAPKLCKAMGHNTHITQLHLNNTMLQRPQGIQLADSLKTNKTLVVLGMETNNVDSTCIEAMARALGDSPDSNLQQWRFNCQKCCGNNFGRPVEEALAMMLEKNTKLLKLGVTLNDAHWRRTIDKLLLRNNDAFRRQRKALAGRKSEHFTELKAEEKTLQKLRLDTPPGRAAWEVFDDDDEKFWVTRNSTCSSGKVPTKEQLQAFAKTAGKPLKFSEVAPLLKEFKTKLLNSFLETPVMVTDIYGTEAEGVLSDWTETNEKWYLDVWPSEESRFAFRSDKAISIEVSEKAMEWLAVASKA
eukprot:TRINITY_DN20012_c0_g2_i1.p1 TRINITY_DN20012_c0_g2~~TRINITY_DN20012_c0_g2_i1.p1  ORF type:complete len:1125 (-),score=293.13 TRINITY_DN20012_c0_g2_i1:277-3651(-)